MLRNIICFQLGWFSCVLGAANHHAWFGVVAAICLIAWQLSNSKDQMGEVYLVLLTMLIGIFFDFVPMNLGWISFEPIAFWPSQLPPPWMILLWGMFATTLNVSLNWLKSKPLISIGLGTLAGPLAYWGGSRLGAFKIVDFNAAMIYLSIGWAVVVPALFKISCLIDSCSDLYKERRR